MVHKEINMKKLLLLCALSVGITQLCTASHSGEQLSIADLIAGMSDEELMTLVRSEASVRPLSVMPSFGRAQSVHPGSLTYIIYLDNKGITDIHGLGALTQRLNNLFMKRGKGERLKDDVHLEYNMIKELNPASFAGLTYLSTLFLNGNQISYVAPGTFDEVKIATLNLNNNKLKRVGPELSRLKFHSLDLSNNPIEEVIDPNGLYLPSLGVRGITGDVVVKRQ